MRRDPFLKRARECAALTVPYLMPPASFGAHSELPTPYQGLGARGVRTLASKLLLTLFPSNTPFFKYNIDQLALRQLEEQGHVEPGNKGEVDIALSARERAVLSEMETALFRPAAFVALQHLIVTGNFVLYIPPKQGRTRGFRLDQYVVRRSPDGTLLELIIKEMVTPGSLAAEVRAAVMQGVEQQTKTTSKGKTTKVELQSSPQSENTGTLEMYTHVMRDVDTNRWVTYQEINGVIVPGSEGTYPLDKLPYIVLRLSTQPGEDYGRSYVEEYLGDLDSLEGLSQSIVEGSAAAARIVFMVNPNGVTSLRVVARAKNGDVVNGNPADVGAMRVDKSHDLSVARQQAQDIAQQLAFAFMLNTAVQRTGERVTAEEIRYAAAELDDAMGGVYTLLGAEFQLPVVSMFEARMERVRKVPPLPKDDVKPQIVTGLEAIGRGHDQQNLKLFVSDIIQVVGPENAMKVINFRELLKRSAASYGIDTSGLIPDEQEQVAGEQQAMIMQLIEQLGPNAINQLGGLAKEGMKLQPEAAAAMVQGMS